MQGVVVSAQRSLPVQAAAEQRPAAAAVPVAAPPHSRRSLLSLATLSLALAAGRPAHAALSENAGGVDSASSPLIQELLRRTEEKREERKKERLDDYYRRNFGDYLAFQAGSGTAQAGSENDEAIRRWLEKNTEPPFPQPPKQ